MSYINENFLELQDNYLFSTVAKKVSEYSSKYPNKKIIKLGSRSDIHKRRAKTNKTKYRLLYGKCKNNKKWINGILKNNILIIIHLIA